MLADGASRCEFLIAFIIFSHPSLLRFPFDIQGLDQLFGKNTFPYFSNFSILKKVMVWFVF
ncbi:hypothetical protein R83H12_02127 [Fibrobacteria bacterium R8-3-H12]